jgi:cob(I)alamin adenosyltransferase
MANKIYTKTGDRGSTSLLGGTRISKDDWRMEATGNIDELSSVIGILRMSSSKSDQLVEIQSILFHIGAIVGTDHEKFDISKLRTITDKDVKTLEKWIDEMDKQLPPLKNFILPTGFEHLARTVARRAERRLTYFKDYPFPILVYLNRLSDYFFVLARYENFIKGDFKEDTISQL